MAAYICVLPLLFFIWAWFFPSLKLSVKVLKVYSLIILFVSTLIMAVNLNIYNEWGMKFPYRALAMLIEYPYEAYISASSSPLLIPSILFISIFILGYITLKSLFTKQIKLVNTAWYLKLPVSLLLIGLLFILIRSGLQTTPLNPSMAYFSTKPILNHAAINTEWNLLSDFLHNEQSTVNPFQYMDDSLANKQINPFINTYKNPVSILKTQKPNVVLIILESFTADLVAGLGGEKGVAPYFEELLENGLHFPNTYSTSDRTDKGVIGIMSAFPSQATKSIIKNVSKMQTLPGIGNSFLANDYKTSFFHGGESAFYNIRSYMLDHGIEDIIDKKDFDLKDVMSKWGAHDHLTFQKQLDYLNKAREPFFSTILTLSNHEPFDLPGSPKFGSNNVANLFRSTAFYTDSVLQDYFTKAKTTAWYKNTLFVLIADHGHRLPLEKWESHHPNRYKIPFIFYGDVLKEEYRGKAIAKVGGQVDLASTLLHQLNIKSDEFYWSKDLLDERSPSFSFFTWDNGFGVINEEQSLSFDNIGKKVIHLQNPAVSDSSNTKLENIGKAYMQKVYQQYLGY